MEEKKYIVIEVNGYDEEPHIYDTLEEAESEAVYLSSVNPKTCILADLVQSDLEDPEDWNSYTGYGHKLNLRITNGSIEIGRYSYQDIYNLYLETKSQIAIDALGRWLEQYDSSNWNGECWPLENGELLYPFYDFVGDDHSDEDEQPEILGFEIR